MKPDPYEAEHQLRQMAFHLSHARAALRSAVAHGFVCRGLLTTLGDLEDDLKTARQP